MNQERNESNLSRLSDTIKGWREELARVEEEAVKARQFGNAEVHDMGWWHANAERQYQCRREIAIAADQIAKELDKLAAELIGLEMEEEGYDYYEGHLARSNFARQNTLRRQIAQLESQLQQTEG